MERAHRLDEQARGVFVISATPFSDDGAVDLDSTDRLIDFYLDKGVSGITILGMMGEAPKLTAAESQSVVQRVLKRVAGRVPVVVGVTNAGTDNLVALSRISMDAGAAGVMVAPLSSLRHEQQVVDYFEDLAGRLGDDIPICYQDYPQATGVHISTATFLRLVEALPSVVMLKHETCPGLRTITAIRAESERAGLRRVSILCGNGGLYLPLELGRGADGAMTGFAYPEMLVQLCSGFASGDRDAAEDLFDAYLPLVRYEQQPGFGLAIRKEILRRRGAIASARTRTPGPAMNADDSRELDRLIQRVEARLED
jgi:4-hydroxy-tetrahydrodipicolinate synthase